MSYSDFFSDYAGTMDDKAVALLAANGATEGTLYDRWNTFFDLNTVPAGSFPDRMRLFLISYLGLTDTGQNVCDLWALITGPYANSPYGTPVNITTAHGSGPFTVTNLERKRTHFQLDQLKTGVQYRIDFDIVSFTGAAGTVESDWSDVPGGLAATAVTVGHYGYISDARFLGYDATYRFVDIQRGGDAGSFVVENLTLREVL